MCKKEKYEKHRNVLVFFFAFAMLVVLNSQKLSLRELSIVVLFFGLFGASEPCDNRFDLYFLSFWEQRFVAERQEKFAKICTN